MIKVCHFSSAHESDDSRVFYKECASLAAAGYKVYLVAQGESRSERGVEVLGLGEPPQGRIKRMTGFAKAVYKKALSLDCDVYHFHDPELLPYGVKLAKKGKKVIFDSHENYPLNIAEKGWIPKPLRRLVSGLYKAYETAAVKRFSTVIIPCTFDGKNAFENRARRTVFIENYPLKEELFGGGEKILSDVCYIGTLSRSRGIENLAAACDEAGATLLLAGRFQSREFESEITAHKSVNFVGFLDRAGVDAAMCGAKIGVNIDPDVGQNFHHDTLGIKVCEYMAHGLPVIVANTPFNLSVVEKEKAGLCVPPDNAKAAANAVLTLLNDEKARLDMGKNGKRLADSRFNWDTEAKKLIALYKDLTE